MYTYIYTNTNAHAQMHNKGNKTEKQKTLIYAFHALIALLSEKYLFGLE